MTKVVSGTFTRIGTSIWDWEPFVNLDDPWARLVWLGLYTTAPAKRLPPGLWHGAPSSIAEAAKVPHGEAYSALQVLQDRGLIAVDRKLWVIRLTALPDQGERPSNGNAIKAWWTRFNTVPPCRVRDEWIDLLKWLLNPITEHHAAAWSDTFLAVEKAVEKRREENGIGNRSGNRSGRSVPPQLDLSLSGHVEIRSPNGSGEGAGSDLGSDLGRGSEEGEPEAGVRSDDGGVPHLRLVPGPEVTGPGAAASGSVIGQPRTPPWRRL